VEFMAVAAIFNRRLDAFATWPFGWRWTWRARTHFAEIERWVASRVLRWRRELVDLTDKGRQFLTERGIEVDALERNKRPLCRTCIDWSCANTISAAPLGRKYSSAQWPTAGRSAKHNRARFRSAQLGRRSS
jgi:hypothetical protein